MAMDVEKNPILQRGALNGSRGLRALEAIKALAAGLEESEFQLVLKLLATAAQELKRESGKAA